MTEWALAGRRFGVWTTWLLVSGNFYTAFHMVWVPAHAYEIGAVGFLAVPYSLVAIPFIAVIMPRLWRVAAEGGHVTAADIVQAQYRCRPLSLALAVIGVIVAVPYIALLLAALQAALTSVGLGQRWTFGAALAVLLSYSGRSGLRAPGATAALKGVAIYLVLAVAFGLMLWRIGGYGTLAAAAERSFQARGAGSVHLLPGEWVPLITAAFGFTTAAFVYPQTVTGLLAARNGQTIRRTLWLLPIFTAVVTILALLAYAAYALTLPVPDANAVTPMVFTALFPSWFAGIAFAALAMAAIGPATMLAVGAATLFARNIWKPHVNPALSPSGELAVAKAACLAVEVAGALLLLAPGWLPGVAQFFCNIWGLQTAPAILLGLFTRRFTGPALLAGLLTGVAVSTELGWTEGLTHVFVIAGYQLGIFGGVVGLAANVAIAACLSVLMRKRASNIGSIHQTPSKTDA